MPFKFPMTIVAIRDYVTNSLATLSADTLGWLAAIVLHCATLPSFLALNLRLPGCAAAGTRAGTSIPFIVHGLSVQSAVNTALYSDSGPPNLSV
jgi:hypothetical protein